MTATEQSGTRHPGFEHALQWLDCLIEREVLRLRARYELSLDELRGLYISDRQVDALLRERIGGSQQLDPVAELTARAQLLAPVHASSPPFASLAERAALSEAEIDIVLLALAPELDVRYETLYAYLNNDITRKHLTVDLALRLLAGARGPDSRGYRSLLSGCAPLFERGVLESSGGAEGRSSLQRGFVLSPVVSQFLTGQPIADPHWPIGVRWLLPVGSAAPPETVRAALVASKTARIVAIVGDDPTERLDCATHWAGLRGCPMLRVPLPALQANDAINEFILAARLGCAAILLDDDGRDAAESAKALANVRMVADTAPATVLLANRDTRLLAGMLDLPFARIEVALPSQNERALLWRRAPFITEAVAQSLAQRFAIGPARIAAATQSVVTQSSHATPTPEDLAVLLSQQAGVRANDALTRLATRLTRPHRWPDLVLPDTITTQLREAANAVAQRERVYHHWGMLTRTARSSGLMMLFTGASGTGKTMAASVVANDVGLDLYRIDLASVVSKYIGETEQNLDRIFNAARGASAILLFDEADALLGKRSEIKDAHDRYANLEVAYLLQKMEEHDGVVILSSNLPKNLDSAFARRMHYTIEFGRPNARLRETLWKGMFPGTVPLAPDLDLRFLAENFETTGGEIQAIALDAAFLAAAEGTPVGMDQLMRAMSRRQTKQGNPGGMARFAAHREAMNGGTGHNGTSFS